MIKIKEITAKQTFALRIEILRDGIATNYRFDADDTASSFHLGAFDGTTCVGIVTFIKQSKLVLKAEKSYQLRGMAVAVSHQKKGIGAKLIERSYPMLKERNADLLWCNARELAVEFYKKNGFKIYGDSFEIPHIGKHYIMYKLLKINN